MPTPRDALDAVGTLPDVEIDIAGAALQLARVDAPDEDWHATERHLSVLARDAIGLASGVASGNLAERVTALAELITGRYRYRGDTETYDDPANANLIHVVERRRGLPVALGVIWLHCARAAGWGAHGVDFPGHFLVALEADVTGRRARPTTAQQVVIDVFAGGVPLEPPDFRVLLKHVAGPSVELSPGLLQPMSTRRVLLRLQENIRVRRLRQSDVTGALACTEDMLRVAPDNAQLWREAALMQERLEQITAAIRSYGRVIELLPDTRAASQAHLAIEMLGGRLH